MASQSKRQDAGPVSQLRARPAAGLMSGIGDSADVGAYVSTTRESNHVNPRTWRRSLEREHTRIGFSHIEPASSPRPSVSARPAPTGLVSLEELRDWFKENGASQDQKLNDGSGQRQATPGNVNQRVETQTHGRAPHHESTYGLASDQRPAEHSSPSIRAKGEGGSEPPRNRSKSSPVAHEPEAGSTSSVPPRASNTRGPNWAWIGQPQRPRDPISSSQGGRASKSQCPNPPFDYVLKQRTHRDPKPTRPQVLMRWAEPDLEISPEGNYGLVWPEDKGIGLCCSSRSSTSYRGQLQRPFVNVVEPSTDSTAHNDAGQPEWWENAQGVSGRGFGGGGYADSSADAQDHDQPSGDDPFLFQDTTYGPFGEHAGDAGSANAANENRHEADSIFSDPRLRDRFDASRRPSTGEVGAAPADQQKGARPAGRMPGRTRNAGTGGYQDSSRGGEGAEVSPDKGLFNIATENGWAGAGVQSDDEDRHSAASIISNPNVRRRFNQNTDPTSANRRGNSFLGDLDDVMTLSPSGDSTVDFGGRGQHASATSGSRHDAASIFSNPLAQQRFDGMSSRRQNSSIGSASRHSAASITSNPFHQAAYDTLRSRNRPRRSGYDAASDAGSSASNGLGILRGAGANSAKEPLNFLASTMPGQPGQPTLNPGGDANAYPPTDPYPPGPGWPAPPAVDPAVAPPSGPPELNGYPVAPFPSPPVHPMFMPQPGYGPPPANFGAPWALNGTTLGQPRFRDEVPCTCSIDPGNPCYCKKPDPPMPKATKWFNPKDPRDWDRAGFKPTRRGYVKK